MYHLTEMLNPKQWEQTTKQRADKIHINVHLRSEADDPNTAADIPGAGPEWLLGCSGGLDC